MRRSLDALSVLSADDLADYDVISDGPRSMESSIADLGAPPRFAGSEPAPLPSAREKFDTVTLTAEAIQAYVQRSLNASLAGGRGDDAQARGCAQDFRGDGGEDEGAHPCCAQGGVSGSFRRAQGDGSANHLEF